MFRKSTVCITVLFIVEFMWIALPQKSMLACSAIVGIDSLSELEETDYVVKARVVEADSIGQNAIIHVEQYFKGGAGPEYLLITRYTEPMLSGLVNGHITVNCETWEITLYPGDIAYFVLHRRLNGSYGTFGTFKVVNGTLDTGIREGGGITETQAINALYKKTHRTPNLPNFNASLYPLHAPILIKTTNGTNYIIPVDDTTPVKLDAVDIPETSDDSYSSKFDFPYTNNRICTQIGCNLTGQYGIIPLVIDDKDGYYAFHVSQTGDVAAFWKKGTLEIKGLWFLDDVIATRDFREKVGITEDLAAHSAWSNDGRFLSYSDFRGLWLWDIYREDIAPRLLVAANPDGKVPYARYFSPLGHYLAINEGGKNTTIDVVTGERLPDGIVSPDEHLLLQLIPKGDLYDISLCGLVTSDQYSLYPRLTCIPEKEGIKQVKWAGSNRYIALQAVKDDSALKGSFKLIDIALGLDYSFSSSTTPELSEVSGDAFDFDPHYNALILLKAEDTLVINGVERNLYKDVDSPIISVEWLPSLLYINSP